MADETRMRGLDERCTALYKALQEETLRRVVTEQNFQDQLHSTNTEMMGKMEALSGKQDQLSHTLEGFQTMFHQIFDRLDLIYQNEASVLGKPPSNTYYEESSSTKSPMVPDLQTRNQQEVRTSLGEPHHHLIPQGMNLFSKLEFPYFDGTLARSWMLRSQNYFQLVPHMNDLQRITLASMHFEGKALQWYQHMCTDVRNLTWGQFLDMVATRFDEIKTGKIIGDFNKLRQSSSLANYIEKFEELRVYMLMVNRDLTEGYFVASFISGLGKELQSFISFFDPQTLTQAIDLAKKQELAIDAINQQNKFNTKPSFVTPKTFTKPTTMNDTTTANIQSPLKKYLTRAEVIQRRTQGLCFNCDEKFILGHRCKNRTLYILMTEEEENLALQTNHSVYEATEIEEEEVMVSLNVIAGSSTNTTMQLKGTFGKQSLYILVDTESTHSFLDENLATKMGGNIGNAFTMNIARVYISKIDALVANFLDVDSCSFGLVHYATVALFDCSEQCTMIEELVSKWYINGDNAVHGNFVIKDSKMFIW